MTYVLNNGTWDPVATVERVESKASNVKTTTLRLRERVNGTWQDTSVLTHTGPDQVNGFFQDAEVFTEPGDGTTLGLVASHCGITVYAERINGTWTYYDAGPLLTRYRVTFDSTPSVVVMGQTSYGAADPVILRKANFQLLSNVQAPASCASVPSSSAASSEVVHVTADVEVPWVFTSGIVEKGGATFISAVAAEGNYKTVEQRLIYRCTATDPWTVEIADRTNSPQTAVQPILTSTGDIVQAYAWGGFARFVGNGPAYSVRPPDFVYTSTHVNNACGLVPGP
jgi:hypothetical protein